MHKNNRVVHQETRDHSTDTQPSTGVSAPQEPALNISGLDTTALTRLVHILGGYHYPRVPGISCGFNSGQYAGYGPDRPV